jgi:hypothetical protein
MQCKHIEHLVMDSYERELNEKELSCMQQHIERCSRCARFQDSLEKIRTGLGALPLPVPSPELLEKTRKSLVGEIPAKIGSPNKEFARVSIDPIPKIIWAALLALILLTVLVIISVLDDLKWNQTLPFSAAAVLTLVLQNAVMLVIAPVLLRRHRWKKSGFGRVSLT